MSATLHATDLAVSLGPVDVLAGVSVSAFPGQRLGIIGVNGVGKSTLLKVLAGLREPDRGQVTLAPPTATVGYLPQEPDRRADETVADFLARRTGVAAAEQTLEAATEALAAGADGADDAYAAALDRWMHLGAADLDARAERVLSDLGLGAELTGRPTAALSGGQAARVSLASILLSRFDVLLLDEPTNDLDFDGLARLEEFVTTADATVVVVSHDRAFLDAVVTDVLEIDQHARTAALFRGGWEAYREASAVARRHAVEDYGKYDAKRDELLARAQLQREWMRRGVRAVNREKKSKDKKEKDKHIKAHNVAQSEKMASKARATERALERLEAVDAPRRTWELQLTIAAAPRSGELVARLEGAVVRRGDFRLGPLDLLVRQGERVAVVGPNGAGKTTLVDLILGRLAPESGTARVGPGVIVGELDQRRERFAGEATLLDGFTTATGLLPEEARTLLAKFGLKAGHVQRPTASLSPGERTRLSLALLQARAVNTLVLDEPTNHLDLPAIEQLEEALDEFPGTVLLISHDRRLLERFAPTRVLEIRDGTVRELPLP
jgi:ATPase subunit of ABC transporter with duplicated ATPase domains